MRTEASKLLNWSLVIKDPNLAEKFRNHAINNFSFSFYLYIAMEVIFIGYRTYQTQMGAGDWDFTTGSKPLTPDKDERLIFAIFAWGFYLAIIGIYFLAKSNYP